MGKVKESLLDDREEKIETFAELFEHIEYDWGFSHGEKNLQFNKKDNMFWINKTYITPTHLSYKTWLYPIASGVFEDLIIFYNLLEKKREDYE